MQYCVYHRYRRRWTVVNFLIVVSIVLGMMICVSLHIDRSPSSDQFCYWGYIVFPGILLASKATQTSIAMTRYIYIYCDMIRRICNDFTKLIVFLTMISVLVSMPYVLAKLLHEERPTLLIMCINGSKSLYNSTLHNAVDNPTIHVFFVTYYIICFSTVLIDIVCYVQIIRYIKKSATQVAVISVTPEERRKGRNVVTSPANLLIWLISLACIIPSTILQAKFLLTGFGKHEENIGFEGYHYATIFALSSIIPLLTIGSSADLRQDIYNLRQKCCHKCNGETEENKNNNVNQEMHNNIELSFVSGNDRAGIYAVAENGTSYPS